MSILESLWHNESAKGTEGDGTLSAFINHWPVARMCTNESMDWLGFGRPTDRRLPPFQQHSLPPPAPGDCPPLFPSLSLHFPRKSAFAFGTLVSHSKERRENVSSGSAKCRQKGQIMPGGGGKWEQRTSWKRKHCRKRGRTQSEKPKLIINN